MHVDITQPIYEQVGLRGDLEVEDRLRTNLELNDTSTLHDFS
jgi:hypothetical protein